MEPTLEQLLDAFDRLPDDDTETAHKQADLLVLQALRAFGGEAGAAVAARWERTDTDHGFWYA